jgi:cytochrome c biogenesis protein CcmG, thiol:disulfide interchange protein DsbE
MKRLIPLIIFMILAMLLVLGLQKDPKFLPSAKIGQKIASFALPDRNNQLLSSNAFLGKDFFLVNFWASWCEACVIDHEFLLSIKPEIKIYGINFEDSTIAAKQWLHNLGNPYAKVLFDLDGRVAMDFGVYGTPETFLFNKQGILLYRYAGVMTDEVWRHEFKPQMREG